MSKLPANYSEYEYTTPGSTWSHDYLWPILLRILLDHSRPKGGDLTNILDLGCGNGAIVHALFQIGYDSWGIDASESGIAIANKQMPGRFFVCDVGSGELPEGLEGRKFDTVISTEVIEHLYAPRDLLKLARRALKPGGSLILSTPYHGYLKVLALALTGTLDSHFTVLWDGGHIKFFSRKTLTKLLNEEGFQVTAFGGAGRLPWLWKSMVLRARVI